MFYRAPRGSRGNRPSAPYGRFPASRQARDLAFWAPAGPVSSKLLNLAPAQNQPGVTSVGATEFSPGAATSVISRLTPAGWGIKCDGTANGFYTAPTNFGVTVDLSVSQTIAAWFFYDGSSTNGALIKIGSSAGFGFGIGNVDLDTAGGNLVAIIESSRHINSGIAIPVGVNHAAMSINPPDGGHSVHLYLNGKTIYTDVLSTGSGGEMLTQLGGYATRPLNQTLIEARGYTRGLRAQEIWELYDPATRWELYRAMRPRFFGPALPPTLALLSWLEMETTVTAQARLSHAYLEVPDQTRARLLWAEFEAPDIANNIPGRTPGQSTIPGGLGRFNGVVGE
jgi:hypothetical protein